MDEAKQKNFHFTARRTEEGIFLQGLLTGNEAKMLWRYAQRLRKQGIK